MIDKEIIEKLKSNLENSVCVALENNDGYLQLLFSSQRLIVQSGWRLIKNNKIEVTDESDDFEQGKLVNLLIQNIVEAVTIQGDYNDLQIKFRNGLTLETFPDSQVFEHWNYAGESPKMIIAGPGNLWSSF